MAGRPGRQPLIVLASAAVTVAMVLLVGWQYAASRTELPPDVTQAVDASVTDAVALATPVLSVRRAPGVLSRRVNVSAFRDELRPLVERLNDTSCLAVSVDGQPMLEHRADLPVIPASTMKLLTAVVALDVLGEDHVFTTRVLGDIADEASAGAPGVVAGDLFLVGGGDPVLGTDWWPVSGMQRFPPTGTTRLEDLADAVVAAGVTRVAGSVVGDGSRYDDEWYPPSWDPSIRKVEAGPIDGLLANDGHDAALEPGRVVDDPAIGAATLLTVLLQQRGVRVDGFPRAGDTTARRELASVTSVALSAIVAEMLTTSDDNTAEMLLKEIGLEASGLGTREAGLAVVQRRLAAWGIPTAGAVLADGSGLSNENRVTCATLLGILQYASIDGPLGTGLPVAGVSGTLTDAFVGSPVAGRLRAKTGTLANLTGTTPAFDPPGVRSLAGYVELRGGGAIEFALVLNAQDAADPAVWGPLWFDLLGPALASYPRGASARELGPR